MRKKVKAIKQVNNTKELPVAEELKIFEGSEEGKVINERQSIHLSQA